MKCNHCGAEIADDSVFCEHCGKKIGEENTPKNDSKKKLALWIGIAAAAVVVVVLAILLFGGGGNRALSAEEIFNTLNAEEHIKTFPNGVLTVCENGDPMASSNILSMDIDNANEVYIEERNIMHITVNQTNDLYLSYGSIGFVIRSADLEQERLKEIAKAFLNNPNNLPELPGKKEIAITFDENGTSSRYPVSLGIIIVFNESSETGFCTKVTKILLQAIYEMRDELSFEKYGVSFSSLTEEYQSRAIRKAIPLAIIESEGEPLVPPPPPDPEEPTTTDNGKNVETVPVIAGDDDNKTFTVVENDPEFPGGINALYSYLAANIKYPKVAQENGITGKVHVTFVVEKDGRLTDIKILRDIGGGCGAEVVRVVKTMPRWNPGKQRGKPVRVQFNLPVDFNLK